MLYEKQYFWDSGRQCRHLDLIYAAALIAFPVRHRAIFLHRDHENFVFSYGNCICMHI